MTTYKATEAGFIIGTHYAKDAVVPLTALQAKYLTEPYGNAVYAAKPKASPAPASPDKPAKLDTK